MGAIMCIGVATANSILMVSFANDERATFPSARDAMLASGHARLRPVLMTATAMILGMLPMSLGLGEGGEQNAPLGRAVIGGLGEGDMQMSEHEATVDNAGAERQPQRRRGKGKMVLLGLLVVGGLLALGIVPRLQQHVLLSARQHEVEDGRVAVTVVRPERAPAATEFVLPGNIQAIEETALYARVNGYLHERFVDIGARVRTRQVLAVIETPELDQELAQARAAL